MSATTAGAVESVKLSLDDKDCSTAKVSKKFSNDDVWISNSIEFFASADTEPQGVYVSATAHDYTRAGDAESVSRMFNLFAHRFTRAEAEALVTILQSELSRL